MRKSIKSYLKQILRIDESRKMSKEERVIKNLKRYMKKRKSFIALFTFCLIFMVSISMLTLWREHKLNKMVAPEQIRKMATFENPKHELPILLSRFYLTEAKAKLIVCELYLGALTGFFIFMLINEFAGFTRNKYKLTVSMWEMIKELENEVKELKAHTHPAE